MSEPLKQQVLKVKEAFQQRSEDEEWENAGAEMLIQARKFADGIKQFESSSQGFGEIVQAQCVERLMSDFSCSKSIAQRAMDTALNPSAALVLQRSSPSVDGSL